MFLRLASVACCFEMLHVLRRKLFVFFFISLIRFSCSLGLIANQDSTDNMLLFMQYEFYTSLVVRVIVFRVGNNISSF